MSFSRLALCVGLSLSVAPAGARADYWTDNRCTLDRPEPTFGNGTFRLDKGKGVAHETFKLGEAVSVRLEHTQCEYVSRAYTFTLKDMPEDANVVGWEYRKAVELLSELEARSARKLKFADEKKALNSYAQLVSEPKPDVDINIKPPHEQFSELISVKSQTDARGTRLIVKIWSGPY